MKPCSLIEIKTDKSDSIGIKNINKPESDLVGVCYKCFPKLTEIGNSNKSQKHMYIEIKKSIFKIIMFCNGFVNANYSGESSLNLI